MVIPHQIILMMLNMVDLEEVRLMVGGELRASADILAVVVTIIVDGLAVVVPII